MWAGVPRMPHFPTAFSRSHSQSLPNIPYHIPYTLRVLRKLLTAVHECDHCMCVQALTSMRKPRNALSSWGMLSGSSPPACLVSRCRDCGCHISRSLNLLEFELDCEGHQKSCRDCERPPEKSVGKKAPKIKEEGESVLDCRCGDGGDDGSPECAFASPVCCVLVGPECAWVVYVSHIYVQIAYTVLRRISVFAWVVCCRDGTRVCICVSRARAWQHFSNARHFSAAGTAGATRGVRLRELCACVTGPRSNTRHFSHTCPLSTYMPNHRVCRIGKKRWKKGAERKGRKRKAYWKKGAHARRCSQRCVGLGGHPLIPPHTCAHTYINTYIHKLSYTCCNIVTLTSTSSAAWGWEATSPSHHFSTSSTVCPCCCLKSSCRFCKRSEVRERVCVCV